MNPDKVINDGGPAFSTCSWSSESSEGLTIRDWFAGKALTAIIKVYEIAGAHPGYKVNIDTDTIAMDAYRLADSMLKAREQ